jgi:hypothetical protein
MAYMAFYRDTVTGRESKTHVVDAVPWCGAKVGERAVQHRVLGRVTAEAITCTRCRRAWEAI